MALLFSDLIMADESYPILKPPQETEYYSCTKGIAEELVLEANREHQPVNCGCVAGEHVWRRRCATTAKHVDGLLRRENKHFN